MAPQFPKDTTLDGDPLHNNLLFGRWRFQRGDWEDDRPYSEGASIRYPWRQDQQADVESFGG